jgi:hypothetical protein
MGYGAGEFMRFGSDFVELITENFSKCIPSSSSNYLNLALLQEYAAAVDNQVFRPFGDRADPTLKWRAHRRLLSAMTCLPERQLGTQLLRSSLIEALSNE